MRVQWEYMAPYIFGNLEDIISDLGKLGDEGWELVQLNPECSDGGSRVFLKRIRQDDLPIRVPEGFYQGMVERGR